MKIHATVITIMLIAFAAVLQAADLQPTASGAGVPVVIYNPLPWTRTDSVEVESPFDVETTRRIEVSDGKESYPAQIIANRISFTARDVPAQAYKTFWLKPASGSRKSQGISRDDMIENQFFRIRVDTETGAITDIFDKSRKESIIPKGSQGLRLRMLMDGREDTNITGESEVIESGPTRSIIRMEQQCGEQFLVQDVTLYDSVPRIDVKLAANWPKTPSSGAKQATLDVLVPTALTDARTIFDVPPDKPGSTQRWIDLLSSKYGIAVLNDSLEGLQVDVKDGTIRLSLLGTSKGPKDSAESDICQVTYSILLHPAAWTNVDVMRRADEMRNPLRLVDSSHK